MMMTDDNDYVTHAFHDNDDDEWSTIDDEKNDQYDYGCCMIVRMMEYIITMIMLIMTH